MAENEGNNMYKFNLSFQQSWHPRELVRKGKKKDPLGKKLRTVPADQYYNSLLNGAPVEHIYDFVYDDNIILYNLSNGLSTFTSESHLAQALNYDERELWKLQTVKEGSEIRINYPTEMELSPIRGSNDHFGIKPAGNMRVRHETFLQMLRCLPWTKLH